MPRCFKVRRVAQPSDTSIVDQLMLLNDIIRELCHDIVGRTMSMLSIFEFYSITSDIDKLV